MLRLGIACLLCLAGCASAGTPFGTPEAAPDPAAGVDLVSVEHAEPLPDDGAPKVVVRGDVVFLDGRVVGDAGPARRAKRTYAIDGLLAALKAKRQAWARAHAGVEAPERALLYLDAAEPASVVKSVFQSVASGGYPRSGLVVRRRDGTLGLLRADAYVPEPPRAPGTRTAHGRLAPEEIQTVVRAGFGRVSDCAGRAWPEHGGRAELRFVIGRDGSVSEAEVMSMDPHEPVTRACLEKVFSSLVFPRPDGGIVTVVYPVVLAAP